MTSSKDPFSSKTLSLFLRFLDDVPMTHDDVIIVAGVVIDPTTVTTTPSQTTTTPIQTTTAATPVRRERETKKLPKKEMNLSQKGSSMIFEAIFSSF